MNKTTIAPVEIKPRHERVDVADVLRGFAVLAIILIHSIEHFNFYSFPPADGQSAWLNFTDRAVWDGLFFMFAGKAYAIFALLQFLHTGRQSAHARQRFPRPLQLAVAAAVSDRSA